MTKLVDFCVGCERCIGRGCPNHEKVSVTTCDHCGEEFSEENIYTFEHKDYCISCVKRILDLEEIEG